MPNHTAWARSTRSGHVGSMRFVYMHSVWFVVWILINLGAWERR